MDPYKNIPTMYEEFPGSGRFDFPEGIVRATSGRGCECYLIAGERYTALYDCGMAYCHDELIPNIESILASLGKESLDIILMSHTHYDHIGAMPYLIDKWPGIKVMGAEKAVSVFASETARATMKRLGEVAAGIYGAPGERVRDIKVDGMRVDRVLKEGDTVDLGGRYLRVYETPGHTDCSLTYHLLPDDILFLTESVGLVRGPKLMHASILKDYRQCIASARKCAAIGSKHLVSCHYGLVPEWYSEQYFTDFLRVAEEQYGLVRDMMARGEDRDAIIKEYTARYWSDIRGNSQPFDAFMENTRIIVRNLMKTVTEDLNCQR